MCQSPVTRVFPVEPSSGIRRMICGQGNFGAALGPLIFQQVTTRHGFVKEGSLTEQERNRGFEGIKQMESTFVSDCKNCATAARCGRDARAPSRELPLVSQLH